MKNVENLLIFIISVINLTCVEVVSMPGDIQDNENRKEDKRLEEKILSIFFPPGTNGLQNQNGTEKGKEPNIIHAPKTTPTNFGHLGALHPKFNAKLYENCICLKHYYECNEANFELGKFGVGTFDVRRERRNAHYLCGPLELMCCPPGPPSRGSKKLTTWLILLTFSTWINLRCV